MRATALRVLGGCVLLLCFSSITIADEARSESLSESFPAGAIAFVEADGLGPVMERIRHSELLEQIVLSPQFRAVEDHQAYQKLQSARILTEAVLDSDLWTAFGNVLGGRWAVALYPGENPQQPVLAAIIEATDQEYLANVNQRLVSVLGLAGERVEYFETDEGRTGFTFDARLSVLIDGRNVLMASTRDLLDIIRNGETESESLSSDDGLVAMIDHLGDGHHVRLFVNTQAVTRSRPAAIPDKLDNPLASLLLSGLLALAKDSPYLGMTFDVADDRFDLVVGVEGNGRNLADSHQVFFSRPEDSGTAPVPEVAGLIGGFTMFRDIDGWYRQRESYLLPEVLPGFDQFETNIGNLLPGRDIGEDVLPLLGDRVTLLAALQSYEHLGGEPGVKLPAFAAIVDLADPQMGADTLRLFFQTLTTVLNLQAGQQGREPWVLDSESYADTQIAFARYLRTPEGESLPIGFNFQPASAQIGDQFLICSSVELCRALIDASQRPPSASRTTNRNLDLEVHAETAAAALEKNRGLFEARAIQGGTDPARAAEEFDALLEAIRSLQALRLSTSAGAETFELHIQGSWK